MQIEIKGIKTGNEENICYICRKESDNGIMIGKSLICKECKKEIVDIDMENVEYDFYKNKIKGAFLNLYI